MGCSGSKVDEQKAVVLCRGRVDLLTAAIRHRHALAAAHSAYSDSLLSVSAALHRLLLLPTSSSSPVVPLPARPKTKPSPPTPPLVSSARYSHPSSHIEFVSVDSDEEDGSSFHSPSSCPGHHVDHYRIIPRGLPFGNIHYARSQPPGPSVAVEQRPPSYDRVQVSSFDPYAAYPSYGYEYADFPGYYGSMGRFFGPSSSLPAMPPPMTITTPGLGGSYSARAPPPPPSPPRTSTWDFLNPFDSYYNHYYNYTPSWSSREVRDEEGIPDLEEIDQEEVKEAYGNHKFAPFSSAAAREYSSTSTSTAREDGMSSAGDGSYCYNSRPAAASRRSTFEPEVVDRNVMASEFQRTQIGQRSAAAPRKTGNPSEVADAIKAQFQRASHCFREFTELLEVGSYEYHWKHSPPYEGDKVMGSRGLAWTLQKLYVWERKLYHEVRAEEKMRLLLRKSRKELNHLLERGAEDDKIASTRNLIKKLSTKIRIAIQVVGSISRKIDVLRDDELWPLLSELVLGYGSDLIMLMTVELVMGHSYQLNFLLVTMWNTTLECHQMQYQLIMEAKRLDLATSEGNFSGWHADETLQLEMEMHKWSCNFSSWINSQRNFAKALNGWLLLCLHHGPEATSDDSPRRMGVPPVFTICNCWSQAIESTSERVVLGSIQALAAALHRLWEQQLYEQNERVLTITERDRWLRVIEKKRRNMHKEVDSLNKKLAALAGQFGLPVYHQVFEGHTAESSSIQLGLEKIFEAMEEFSATSAKAYAELLKHCGEHT
ncbi:hypothetical protein Cni_G18491 [Canna indica]|uniref:Nitrate regulatory gene2 protein n=1 Tax=Canna indica TaxID=4628 RepID=A0AAQ3KIY9_9LILI|nr:hypothetical protein Cni_G18491 [Canna indica]